ncbi:hypothetical protein SCG7109_AY_00050 [Chlamydiales bacterium SCGC AG-110-M15]|nr:hypothetical protein SCG7109_AY_00050 [Chlamydiales bacterium SCGC AG-110-M15]
MEELVSSGAPIHPSSRQSSFTTVLGSVDVISGSYSRQFNDLVVPGPEPLTLSSTYSSSDSYCGQSGFGMRLHVPKQVEIPCAYHYLHDGNPHALVTLPSGHPVAFERQILQWSNERSLGKRTVQIGHWTFHDKDPGFSNLSSQDLAAGSATLCL